MQAITATLRTSPSRVQNARGHETLLCCREVDLGRHPATWGYAWLNRCAGSANSAGSHSPRILHLIDVSTIAVARRNIARSCSWKQAERNQKRPEHHRFEALSLGNSGGRAFCFSAVPLNIAECRASRALSLDGRSVRDACVPPSRKSVPADVDSPIGKSVLARTRFQRSIRSVFHQVRPHVFRSPERIQRAAEPAYRKPNVSLGRTGSGETPLRDMVDVSPRQTTLVANFGRSFVFEVLA